MITRFVSPRVVHAEDVFDGFMNRCVRFNESRLLDGFKYDHPRLRSTVSMQPSACKAHMLYLSQ
jgi:hypothetical protein